jgi:hypothetical protein
MKKFFKIIGLVIVTIVILPLIIAIFINSEYSIEKFVVVYKPNIEVFNYVKHLKNQTQYSVWQQRDPEMKQIYTGEDGQVGFVSRWESDNEDVGIGEQEITKIVDGIKIETELRFYKPFEQTDQAYFKTNEVEDGITRLSWGFYGKMDYPMNLLLLFMDFEEMVGKDLELGLQNIKKILENNSSI